MFIVDQVYRGNSLLNTKIRIFKKNLKTLSESERIFLKTLCCFHRI